MNQGTEWSITLEICLEWSCKDTFIPPRICRPSPKRTPSGSLHLFPERCITSEFVMSVQFSRTVVSDSLRPHEPQHARPPSPSPTPGVHSDSWPSSRWCHPAISSSVIFFSSCPQSLPASESFPMSQLFAWGGQSTRVSALASFLPKKTQGWSLLDLHKNKKRVSCFTCKELSSHYTFLTGKSWTDWKINNSSWIYE